MGRKLSIFLRQKKPQLKLLIPQVVEDSNAHQRVDTLASNSPLTPTSSTSLYYDKRHLTISSNELEKAITKPTANNAAPLMDYSGNDYFNSYIKLPNGNWMVRVRNGNRKIAGSYEIDSSMI